MKKKSLGIILSIVLIVGISIYPLMTNKESEFAGADGIADEVIAEIAPDYEPWIESMWAPPGSETESLLFALQAAVGSGVFCFFLGYLYANNKNKKVLKENKEDK